MFRWLIGLSDEQPTEEAQWRARRQVKELVDRANDTQAEWEDTTSKWDDNDQKVDLDYQARMEDRMRSVRFFRLFWLIDYKMML
jgi:hypothetical protein